MGGHTKYSARIPGNRGNYGQTVRFDNTDGYIGISQWTDEAPEVDRVLLSPAQVEALLDFLPRRRVTRSVPK